MGQRDKVLPKGGRGAEAKGGGGDRGGGGVVGWENLLRRMPVRVLLVEGDDSTRHIIAALLRKCGYRVAAASDGLKAWETLKERAHSVDLVLTEVELPVVSGFVLLTMIMEHQTCMHIPVIMMSSHDSVSMVFKCMLKGAADFLVKPIRKNELRNLWQHVWRRRFSSGGHGGLQCHYKNLEERKPDANIENNASNYLSEYVACMQTCMDNSEKASDAQSSCTMLDMEAESMQESRKPRSMDLPHLVNTAALNDEKHLQSGSTLVMLEDEGEEGSTMLGSEASPCNEVCYISELIPEEDNASMVKLTANEDAVPKGFGDYNDMTAETNWQTHEEAKHSKEVVDLIGSMDNQQQCPNKLKDSIGPKNNLPGPAEFLVREKNSQFMSNSIPILELSLRRYYHSGCHKKENAECSTLNHSNSSAFSLYNSKTVLPTSSTPGNSGFEQDEYFTGVKSLWNQDFGNGSNAAQCNAASLHMNQEDAKLPCSGLPSHDGIEIQAPLGAIHFPVPIMWQANGPVMQSMFYPQSGQSFCSTIPTMCQETVQGSLSYQSDPEKPKTVQSNNPDGQSDKCPSNQPTERMDLNMEVLDKQKHISSATGESGDSNICIGSRSHFNGRECGGSLCFVSNGNGISQYICKSPIESGNDENGLASDGYKPSNYHHLNPREAALTKFRMKRKDRCYDKKVRYQSRKRLAEQRPRVKGQFIRQVQLHNSTNG